ASIEILPALAGTVTINGTIQVGHTLTVDTSALDGDGTISYQWKRGETEIGTESTYQVLLSDVGSQITVTVTRLGYFGSVTSDPTDTVIEGVPVAPSGVTAVASSTSSIRISWSPVSNATGYYVYQSSSSSGTYNRLATVTSTSYIDTGLSSSTSYYYRVSAYNDFGEGFQSARVVSTTYGPPNRPANIGNTSSTGFYGWPPNVSGYRYYYAVTAVNDYGESERTYQR
ncbi:MAG: fibronectin type III domain-containing protein, partial [Treponema sp.]|nr:fibronectin type III domain-containing protein [Treponema sp.]